MSLFKLGFTSSLWIGTKSRVERILFNCLKKPTSTPTPTPTPTSGVEGVKYSAKLKNETKLLNELDFLVRNELCRSAGDTASRLHQRAHPQPSTIDGSVSADPTSRPGHSPNFDCDWTGESHSGAVVEAAEWGGHCQEQLASVHGDVEWDEAGPGEPRGFPATGGESFRLCGPSWAVGFLRFLDLSFKSDWFLFQELHTTIRAMQDRIVQLLGAVSNEEVTGMSHRTLKNGGHRLFDRLQDW